ncbi:MAG: tetratricopeptide repeat protein [Myxococcales bacterium]|nr:tetratricopeptide repeat protein [Myxococcales bacterium]
MTKPDTTPTDSEPALAASGRASRFMVLLFVSGFCGISYEVLYARLLGNLIGDQMAVSASILITFLLGTGVGALYAFRLWRHLWLVELGIGLCGILFALGDDLLDTILYASIPMFGTSLGGSVLICIVITCVPTFLIGCTLPLLIGYLNALRTGEGFAKGYMLYNLGAAATALLIEFWILRSLGLSSALLVTACVNIVVALVLRIRYAALRGARPTEKRSVGKSIPGRDKLALALVSVASAIFQLMMIKVAECLLGPFHETFALVLASVLIGIALGAAVTARFRLSFANVVVINLIGLILFMWGFGEMAEVYANLYGRASEHYWSSIVLKFAAVWLLMMIPSASFGATIPALLNIRTGVTQESGELLFVSSIANVMGFLLMAFGLHRYLDYWQIVGVVAAFSIVSMFVRYGVTRALIAWALVSSLVLSIAGTFWDEDTLYLGHTSFHSRAQLENVREVFQIADKFKGQQDVFAIVKANDLAFFFINGHRSMPLNAFSEKLLGAFSTMFAPATDNALILGVGSGATANTVGQVFDHTTAIEINPVVLENLFRMKEYNFDIESNSRMSLVLDDAIHYVKASDEKFSLIVNTVTTPLYFSSSKIYTNDFLGSAKKRLTPGGIYVTWVDARVGDRGIDIILNTMGSVFGQCGLGWIKAGYFLLMCSDEPIRARQAKAVWSNEVLRDDLMKRFGIVPELLPYGLLTPDVMPLVGDADAPINSLNHPHLEFHMSWLREKRMDRFTERLSEHMSLEAQRQALGTQVQWNPFDLLAHVNALAGGSTVSSRWEELVKGAHASPDYEAGVAKGEERLYSRLAHATSDPKHYLSHAYSLLRQKRYRDAIAPLKRASEQDPELKNVQYNLGISYERIGRLEEALSAYQSERRLNQADNDVTPRIGSVALRLKRYPLAIKSYGDALEHKDGAASWRGLVRALAQSGQRKKAIETCATALQRYPQDRKLHDELRTLRASETSASIPEN